MRCRITLAVLFVPLLSPAARADVVPATYSAPAGRGCLVATVRPQSPAEAAGLVSGDVILAAGDFPIESVEQLRDVIAKSASDLPLKILRGGKTTDVVAHFGEGESGRKLGILCGPVPSASHGAEISSVTLATPTVQKTLPTACPYAVAADTKVRLSLKDGRTLNGKLIRCDGDQIAIRTGLMYRVFDETQVAGLESR